MVTLGLLQVGKTVSGTNARWPAKLWFRFMVWLAVGGFWAAPSEGLAQSLATQEYQVKAAFLFNFAQFVTWPTNAFLEPQAPLVIGIIGSDPFGSTLDEMVRGEKINGHPLTIQRFRRVEEFTNCHILFINESEPKRIEDIFTQLKGRSVLTVGDSDEFVRRGGMIRFFTEKGKLRLRINTELAKKVGLEVSSRLLRLATIVPAETK